MKLRTIQVEEKPSVQMTPLIDCVFILLIFFLVTSMLQKPHHELSLDVPHSGVAEKKDQDAVPPLVIELQASLPKDLLEKHREMARLAKKSFVTEEEKYEVTIILEGEMITKDELDRKLQQYKQTVKKPTVRIDCIPTVLWKHVIPILDLCHLHGITAVEVKVH